MRYLVIKLALPLLLCMGSIQASELMLNGLAPYQRLNKEYYLAAFYTSRPITSVEAFQADTHAKRMVIKVSTRKWSPRRFNLTWKQDIAINNDLTRNPETTALVLEFTETPADDLTVGDMIVIDFTPDRGTRVTLNDSLWLESSDAALFQYLANAWLGQIPSSRRFQETLLAGGQSIPADLLGRYERLTVPAERRSLLTDWAELNNRDSELEAERLAAEAQALAEAERRERERARLAAQAKAEAEAQAKAAAEAEAQASARAKARAEAEATAAAKAWAEAEEAERLAQRKKEEDLYLTAAYRWELQRRIYPLVTYPEWSRQLSQEGLVAAKIIVDSNGQLLEIARIEPANSGLLGQALSSAIEAAAPFPPVPQGFQSNKYSITIDYDFRLNQPVAALPDRPAPPPWMEAAQIALSDAERNRRLEAYQSRVREQILSRVEYPYWAENLGYEGRVSLLVRIRPDGSVDSIQLREKSRHAVLNKELQDAAQRSSPFEALPPDWGFELAEVSIVHDFKLP